MRILRCLLSKVTDVTSVSSTSNLFHRIMMHFPDEGNISLAFAYGSGVFPQKGHQSPSSNMLDFVFVVRDPLKWHTENLKFNDKHYSSTMKLLGPEKIVKLQENYGANVFYNTLVPCEKRMIKYGIISNEKLESDLVNWDSLYISGRLHKPVNVIRHNFEHNPNIMLSMRKNLQSALFTSFLMLPETFTEKQLYMKVAGLSYLGDFRMKFGEDKNKVANIVAPNYSRFQDLYHPVLEAITSEDCGDYIIWDQESGLIEVDSSPKARHIYLEKLPLKLQIRMVREFDKHALHIRDTEDVLRSIARYANIEEVVRESIIYTVKKSSKSQSLKSFIGVGPIKGWKYGSAKIAKMWKSIRDNHLQKET